MAIKNILVRYALAFLVFLISLSAQEKLTLDKIFNSSEFYPVGLSQLQWNSENQLSFYQRNDENKSVQIISINPVTKEEKILLTNDELDYKFKYGQIYRWSPDSKYILFTDRLNARKDKSGGRFVIVDAKMKKVILKIESDDEQELVQFSPDGSKIGFVRSNNIYVIDIKSGTETKITFDGNDNILNGKFDWVYEEEFSIIYGWEWSPDSKKIAYWQLDQTEVSEVQIATWDSLYFSAFNMKYPKPGGNNSQVRIGVADLGTLETIWMKVEKENDFYIPRMKFTNVSNTLSVQRLNRDQNHLELIFCDVNTGVSKVVLDNKYKTWIKVDDNLTFLKDNKHFLWTSQVDGFNHIYLYDFNGRLVNKVTKGKWEVDNISSVDELNKKIYYISNEGYVGNRELYSINFDGTEKQKIIENEGTHSVNFSYDSKYFVDRFSSAESNTTTKLYSSNGNLIINLKESKEDLVKKYDLTRIEFGSFETTDGIELNYSIMKPKNFDPKKKYPLLVYNYSGPGSQVVLNSWRGSSYAWYSYLTDNDIIVAWFDNRGTGGRGKEFKDHVYKRLGYYEVGDIVEGINYLVGEGFINFEKIAIWGWSYGGYVSSLAIAKVPNLFNCAIAVAPVTDWKFYNTIYTERYMSTPEKNPDGYKNGSVLTYAENIKGKLLLVHGTADDNVHFQNSVKLSEKMIENKIQYETLYYPEKNHSISGGNTRIHLYTYMTNFLLDNLK